MNIRKHKCYLFSPSFLLNTCFSDKAKNGETLMDVTKRWESLSLSYLIIRSKYLLLSPYVSHILSGRVLSNLFMSTTWFSFQLGALAVLGVSIWILVDQPSFLKVLNLTDDVVGGFQVSFFYIIKNIFFKLHLVRTCKSTKAQPLYFWLSLFWSSLWHFLDVVELPKKAVVF